MFFEQERRAYKYASLGMILASFSPLNYAVAVAAATVFNHKLTNLEYLLLIPVFAAAMIYPSAQFFLPYAIPCFAVCLAVDVLEWWMSLESPNAPRV